jgi:hypothetical protein
MTSPPNVPNVLKIWEDQGCFPQLFVFPLKLFWDSPHNVLKTPQPFWWNREIIAVLYLGRIAHLCVQTPISAIQSHTFAERRGSTATGCQAAESPISRCKATGETISTCRL